MANYQYKLTSTGQSSQTYGNCEVCKKYVSDVFYQVESIEYEPGNFTYYECKNYFGHEDCLLAVRRPTPLAVDGALCSCLHPGQLKNNVCQKCGLPYFRPATNA